MSDENLPESSPGVGPIEGSPTSREASPEAPAQEEPHGPIPYERFAETQRERTQFKAELERTRAELEAFNELKGNPEFQRFAFEAGLSGPPQAPAAPAPAPSPPPADTEGEDDLALFDPLAKRIGDLVGERLQKVESFIETQQREALNARLEAQLAALTTKYPTFDRTQDWPHMLRLIQTKRASTIEGAWKQIAFDRVQAGTAVSRPGTSPGHDVSGGGVQGAEDATITTLREEALDPKTVPSRREECMSMIAALKLKRSGFHRET